MDKKESIKNHFDSIAGEYDYWKRKNSYYYSLIKSFYRKYIPPESSVIEFGCATGEILASCKPKRGVGIDISKNILQIAKNKYPQYEFRIADAEDFSHSEQFDYVIMSDLIDHLSNIPKAIENAQRVLNSKGRLIITSINPLWNPIWGLLEKLNLKMPEGPHCFIPNRFIEFFCQIKGFKVISKGALIFIPKKVPLVSSALNNIIPKLPILNRLCWVQTLIAEKDLQPRRKLSYSVIIPVYNEEKNIEECIRRIPRSNRDYEIIVIDDGSEDATPIILRQLQKEVHNLRSIRFSRNRGKAYAVEEGIRCARKEVVMVLDADMAVAPEDIPLFIQPLERGVVEFVNGTRLIYNMEKKAMSQIKRIGNFLFALLFSLILKFRLTDTLCGTKVFYKKHFQDIKISGERWGDFVLLWTAKKKGLKIGELPIRYYVRKAGQSKMNPFRDGLKFMRYILRITLKEFLNK